MGLPHLILTKDMTSKTAHYVSGHHETVLRSHTMRTAANSAAYLVPSIQPHMHILDVGCGPGTITADFAALVPQGRVVGLEPVAHPLEVARATLEGRGLKNAEFVVGDVHKLDFDNNIFDVAHCHQVLQHIGDPVQALREMRRVTKEGGYVAARECDFSIMTWFPEVEGLQEWQDLWIKVARANGGEPDAGRRLVHWALEAGFERDKIKATTTAWCFSTPEERAWWGGMWAERVVTGDFTKMVVEGGHGTTEGLQKISEAWKEWIKKEDGWFTLVNGEILYTV
jgi:SAM-dependent methyltransferase